MNMTLDGVNIQDNLLKNGSGGAFYPVVYPRTDAIEEVSVTSAASGAENLGEGAVQIKFVTKSGTNEWHGGAFVQERNTFLNANTYFNNIDGLPRDRIILHQVGAHVGGPIVKNRAFIFFNYEVFRFPQSWNAGSFQNGGFLTVLTKDARGTNGHVEALHRLILEECWRPAFARYLHVRFTGLKRDLDRYINYYDNDRTHHGRLTRGRIPADIVYGATKVKTR